MPKIICNGAQNKGFKGADAVVITGMQIGRKRYIDAEKLKDEIRKEFPALGDRIAINAIINSQPTADVRKNVHGEWKQKAWIDEKMEVHEDILVTKCSECGMTTYWLIDEELWKFCPNCGARMDRERRDDDI